MDAIQDLKFPSEIHSTSHMWYLGQPLKLEEQIATLDLVKHMRITTDQRVSSRRIPDPYHVTRTEPPS